MKRGLISILSLALFLAPISTSFAFSGSEVHILKDGSGTVTGVKVMQIAGSTLFTRMYWGDAYVRLTVKTNNNTKFFRGTGELTTLGEISQGDFLDVSGQLDSGSDVLMFTATTIKNSSVQKEQTFLSGKVTSVDMGAGNFVLNSTKFGVVTVNTSTTTQFVKGNRNLDLAHILVGDTITKTSGDYDYNTKTLQARTVVTYVNLSIYKPNTFQGTLQSIAGTSVPTSLTIFISGKTYTVNLTDKTTILNKVRSSVSLSRFVVGDNIRIYGAIRETDDLIIDASIVRNIDL